MWDSATDKLPAPDAQAATAVATRAARSLRPSGAFARLDAVASWLAGWQRTERPHVHAPAVVVFAGDHGVVEAGVTAYPSSVTAEVVRALETGDATAAVMARQVGATLHVVDAGVGRPTANLVESPAMTVARFEECWELGRDAVARVDADLIAVGEVGIGNTTASAAVAAALCGGPSESWVGTGSGLDAQGLARKIAAVDAARRRIGAGSPPLEVLREVGGCELVAIAAAVLEARRRSAPVLLDGYVTTAAVTPLAVAQPGALDHCLAAHVSPEPGHARLLAHLGKQPLLDLGLRLGEGTGALAAIPLVRLAAAAVVEVPTFEEWGLAPP